MAWKHTTYHVDKSDIGHTILSKNRKKTLEKAFDGPVKKHWREGERKNFKQLQGLLHYMQT